MVARIACDGLQRALPPRRAKAPSENPALATAKAELMARTSDIAFSFGVHGKYYLMNVRRTERQ